MQKSTEMHISCNAEEEKLKEVAEKEIYDNEQNRRDTSFDAEVFKLKDFAKKETSLKLLIWARR